jgi:hypothetical protein
MTDIDPQILQVSQIYQFQQMTLPGWVFDLGSTFFIDLFCREYGALKAGASEAGGKKFTDSISVKDVADPEGHLITFAPPEAPTLCRFIFICVRPQARFFTAEISGRVPLMLCEKQEDGGHSLHGPLKNKTAKAFLDKIREILRTEN